jgi:hypothetical protein
VRTAYGISVRELEGKSYTWRINSSWGIILNGF